MRPIRAALLATAGALTLLPTASLAGAPPPPTLDGENFYLDRNDATYDKHKTTTNIDLGSDQFCFAGQLRYVDTPFNPPNMRVDVDYSVLGTVAKADGDQKVQGDFSASDVSVAISVYEIRPTAEGGPTLVFGPSSVMEPCDFTGRAWITSKGIFDRVFLSCDVSAIVADLLANPSYLGNVTSALARKKNIKLDLATNILTIRGSGVVTPGGPTSDTLSCPIAP